MRNSETAIGSIERRDGWRVAQTRAARFDHCRQRWRAMTACSRRRSAPAGCRGCEPCAARSPPNRTATGYSTSVIAMYIEHCRAMYQPSAADHA